MTFDPQKVAMAESREHRKDVKGILKKGKKGGQEATDGLVSIYFIEGSKSVLSTF